VILWGSFTILSTEILSLVNALTQSSLTLLWAAAFLLSLSGLYTVRKTLKLYRPSFGQLRLSSMLLLWLGLGVILLLTWVVAVKSPPQTWDSLNYHMSRVAHWAQQKSVRHYATGIEVQNNMPPGAEILVTQVYVLSQGDQWVNLIQWFAMLGSIVGASWIAKQLGAGRVGQILAAVFVATLPMGIAEASSTMTDYVLAFWLVCVAVEMLYVMQGRTDLLTIAFLGLATGLGVLTKPTAFAFLLPFAIATFWFLLRRMTFRQLAKLSLLAAFLIVAMNLGHFVRNTVTYGNPIGPPDRFEQHANQLLSIRGTLSNLVRNVGLHIQTPSPHVNKALAIGVQWFHQALDLDVNDPRTTAAGRFKISVPRTNEILIGNPLHALFILVSIAFLIRDRKRFSTLRMKYSIAVIAMSIVFSFAFKWLIFGSRLQLPFFVLFGPIVVVTIGDAIMEKGGMAIGSLLILSTIPWLVGIDSRPLVPISDQTLVDSVMTESSVRLLFANGLYLEEPTRDLAVKIEEAACKEIGVMFAGNGVEYPLWSLLNSPRQDLMIEWIVRGTFSATYSLEGFEPCAVVCENCAFLGDVFQGLSIAHERAPYRLYLKEEGL
jgi:hypothetical protein